MNDWTAQAFVLKVGHFREIDLWLKMLVPAKGIITAFAFGGAKSKRRFPGCLDVLNTLDARFTASRQANCFTLAEAELIASPRSLRSDWSRMGIATNCLRFLESAQVPEENAAEVFLFMEDFRASLDKSRMIASLFPFFFRFSLACRLGYAPDFFHCGVCAAPLHSSSALFLLNEGIQVCSSCQARISSPTKYHVFLPASVRIILQSVRFSLPSAWSDEALFSVEKRVCSYAIDGFIQYHLGIVWDKGAFRRI
ncbi:MAG: DNA repair protein RecO [Desulfovibrionaceae bacterium]|nr:DNA repair protein RecO [Desulfovibrionaceae bacterium]